MHIAMPQYLKALLVLLAVAGPSLAVAAEIPKVALSEQHRAMCKVGVGEAFPEIELQTPNGDAQPIKPLLGRRATVIVFYQPLAKSEPNGPRHGWMTRTLLADLGPDVSKPFGDNGVSVIAVSVGAEPAGVGGALALVDPEGAAMAQVGSGRMPRVYVLDPKGTILWFDIEYSMSTRRELAQTLNLVTGAGNVARAKE